MQLRRPDHSCIETQVIKVWWEAQTCFRHFIFDWLASSFLSVLDTCPERKSNCKNKTDLALHYVTADHSLCAMDGRFLRVIEWDDAAIDSFELKVTSHWPLIICQRAAAATVWIMETEEPQVSMMTWDTYRHRDLANDAVDVFLAPRLPLWPVAEAHAIDRCGGTVCWSIFRSNCLTQSRSVTEC